MRFKFVEKNSIISDELKNKIINKLSKLDKFLNEEVEAIVTYSVVKKNQKMEVTIPIKKRILRAEVTSADVIIDIGTLYEKLEAQLMRYKGRLRSKSKNNKVFIEELDYLKNYDDELDNENEIVIEKTKKFALKPMDAEEAVLEMELTGHNFYVFRNSFDDEVNVVYKRKNGNYGIIEPI